MCFCNLCSRLSKCLKMRCQHGWFCFFPFQTQHKRRKTPSPSCSRPGAWRHRVSLYRRPDPCRHPSHRGEGSQTLGPGAMQTLSFSEAGVLSVSCTAQTQACVHTNRKLASELILSINLLQWHFTNYFFSFKYKPNQLWLCDFSSLQETAVAVKPGWG